MASNNVKKPQKRFQFIDNSNAGGSGTNSTRVRRHVMQEYMREKRWEARKMVETGTHDEDLSSPDVSLPRKRSAQRQRQAHQETPGSSNSDTGLEVKTFHSSKSPIIPTEHSKDWPQDFQNLISQQPFPAPLSRKPRTSPSSYFRLSPSCFAQLADMISDVPLTPLSPIDSGASWSPIPSFTPPDERREHSPSSLLSAARTDPFDSLPMRSMSRQDKELFDFYATVMPACSYGFERRNPRAHNWYLSVFIPEAMKGLVTFENTVLVHAANTQAWVKNLPSTPLALEHRARSSELLTNHYLRHPHDTSDAIITATMSAAALEDFDPDLNRRPIAWMHWKAAMQKIRSRGGPASLEQQPSLRMLVNWQDYIFSGYDGRGSTFFFTEDSAFNSNQASDLDRFGKLEIAQQCEEFIIFLRCTEQLALVAANMANNPVARQHQQLRHSAFEPGQPLFELLASPNGPRYTKTGQLKQIISRLAALMTINVAIWEYRYRLEDSEDFFAELIDDIYYNDLDKHISVEALLQILLTGSKRPKLQHSERPWLVSRLLKVAKRLGRASWEKLNDFLLDCLTLKTSVPTVQSWEPHLRTEIVNAPLVSYVLPLMQAP